MKSIRSKLILFIVLLLSSVIILLFTANTLFLEFYYVKVAEKSFTKEYLSIKENYSHNKNTSLDLIRERAVSSGYKILIIDSRNSIILSSAPEFKPGRNIQLTREQKDFFRKNKFELQSGKIFYTVLKHDKKNKKDLLLAGQIDKENYLYILQPMEKLVKSAETANNFLLMIGTAVLLISVSIVYFLAEKFVKPVKEITGIAEKISDLDFSERYTRKTNDEIGVLGQSINNISEKLDASLTNLEKTNTLLKNEMEIQKKFLASVTHEFKTPVGLIKGYAESIKLDMADSKEQLDDFSEIIIQEADRLDKLISEIIFMMKMESEDIQLNISNFNISETIRNSVKKLDKFISKTENRIVLELEDPMLIQADESKILQVIENILINALKYGRKGGLIKITVKKTEKGFYTGFYNEGEYVDDKHLPQIFDPFYIVRQERTRNITGSGLGLSIVKSIINKHGGECGFENAENGVNVWFII